MEVDVKWSDSELGYVISYHVPKMHLIKRSEGNGTEADFYNYDVEPIVLVFCWTVVILNHAGILSISGSKVSYFIRSAKVIMSICIRKRSMYMNHCAKVSI